MKSELTIGFFIDTFFPMIDDVIMVVDNYARRLCKKCNVVVFAPSPIKGEYDDSVFPYEVVRCKSIPLPFVDYTLPIPKLDIQFEKKIEEYNLDIVHIHSPASIGLAGIKYAKKHNSVLIGTLHSQYKQDIKRAVKSDIVASRITKQVCKIYEKCDYVWTVKSEVSRIFVDEYGYKGKTPEIVSNATDMLPVIDKDKSIKNINNKYNLNKNDKLLLFVGRLNKLKNIMFIIDSLIELEKMNLKYNYKMMFVGNGQDEEELKSYVHSNKLDSKVIFTGRVEDRNLLCDIFARADLFLFPSWYDSNSLVQIEAASQGCPTMFIEGTATSALVTNDRNGYKAGNSPFEYANKINSVLVDNKLHNKVRENCYKEIYKTWDEVVDEVYEKYNKLKEEKEN